MMFQKEFIANKGWVARQIFSELKWIYIKS